MSDLKKCDRKGCENTASLMFIRLIYGAHELDLCGDACLVAEAQERQSKQDAWDARRAEKAA